VREPTDRDRIERFLMALARGLKRPVRLYLVGGAALVEHGLKSATLDIDSTADADDPRGVEDIERLVPGLKERLRVNVEWADPTEFLPIPRSAALTRSLWKRSIGPLHVYHFDYASVALGKIGRGAERDFEDVVLLARSGALAWADVERLWEEVRARPFGRVRATPADLAAHLAVVRVRLELDRRD